MINHHYSQYMESHKSHVPNHQPVIIILDIILVYVYCNYRIYIYFHFQFCATSPMANSQFGPPDRACTARHGGLRTVGLAERPNNRQLIWVNYNIEPIEPSKCLAFGVRMVFFWLYLEDHPT